MANSDKDILITPNSGSSSADPKIEYVGANSTGNDTITVETLYDGTKATLSFEGSAGQLFSVVNDLSSDPIFSVNDVSGIPSIEVDSDGEIRLAEFSGNVGIGISTPTELLHVDGRIKANNLTLASLSAQNSEATAVMIDGSGIIGTRELGSNAFNSTSYLTGNQTITLSGDVSGSGTTSIAVTIADDSHNHIISNVDGLQAALDAKAPLASPSFTTKITTPQIHHTGTISVLNGSAAQGMKVASIYAGTSYSNSAPSGMVNALNGFQVANSTVINSSGNWVGGGNISEFTNNSGYITGNQTITLSGDVSGSGTTSISVTVADDSHNHVISNVDGLQTALDGKLSTSGTAANSQLLDSIDSTGFLRSNANDTLSSTLKVTGSIIHEFSSIGGYIARPKGAQYTTTTGTVTGAIKIKLPTHGTDDMLSFWVDIYDYTSGESVTMWIGGYLYQTTGGNEWVNETALIFTEQTGKAPENVRFGGDGTNNCIWIGETTDTWSYPQVIVRDFQCGYTSDIDAYDDNWAISFVTSFDTVDATRAAKGPVTEWDRVESKPSFATVATSGSYNDLSNTPTIPTNNNQLTNGAGYITDGNTNWNNSYGFITASDSSITNKLPLAGGSITPSGWSAPPSHAALNIGYNGGGQTRAIDIDGGWGANESKAITFTHGSSATNIVGQWDVQHNGPGSRMRWGRLYHSGDSSTYTMELISTSTTAADLYVNNSKVIHLGNDGSGSGLDADNLDGSTWSTQTKNVAWRQGTTEAGSNNGLGFWGNTSGAAGSYAIYMSAYNGTYGGLVPGDANNQDYNMYFKMTAGTNRGFIFKNGSTNLFGIDGGGRVQITGDLYGKYVANAYSNLYRFGGLYFTWDSDTYGTNTHHSIRSTYGDTYGDDITLNSFHHIRFNIDSNNNNTDEVFQVGRHTTGTGNILMTLDTSGNLSTSGNITAYSSDRRLKKNFKKIENPLDKLLSLNGYNFDWRMDKLEGTTFEPDYETNDIGLIAQEVQAVCEQATAPAPFDIQYNEETKKHESQSGKDYLTVNYDKLVPLLVEAIKEQQETIEKLTSRINDIEKGE